MTYTPNIHDPRVNKRIRLALGFVRSHFSRDKPQSWASRYIDQHLGHMGNELSKWLRSYLLITTNNHYAKDDGICKEHILNQRGYDYIKSCINSNYVIDYTHWLSVRTDAYKQSLSDLVVSIADDSSKYKGDNRMFTNDSHWDLQTNGSYLLNLSGVRYLRELTHVDKLTIPSLSPSVIQVHDDELVKWWANEKYINELTSLNFEYQDKSSRLWHPLQNVKSRYKKIIFAQAGLKNNYDIQCCAPTLIHQYAQKKGMDLYLWAIRRYIADRAQMRRHLATSIDIDTDDAKQIINALFAGARIANNSDTAIFQILKGDLAKIECLKQLDFIVELRSDIKTCWEYIQQHMTRTSIKDKNNRTRMLPITSREKWNVYFELERQVIDSVSKYMQLTDNKFFLEHDGWCASNNINVTELITYVKTMTDYSITVDVDVVDIA